MKVNGATQLISCSGFLCFGLCSLKGQHCRDGLPLVNSTDSGFKVHQSLCWKICSHNPIHWFKFCHFKCWCVWAIKQDLQCSGRCGVYEQVCFIKCCLRSYTLSELNQTDRRREIRLVCVTAARILSLQCVFSYLNRRHYAKASVVSTTLQVTVITKMFYIVV